MHCKACVPPLMIDRSRIKTHIAKHHNIDGRIDGLTDKGTSVSCKTKLSVVNNSCFFQLKGWYKEKADSAYRPVLLKHKEKYPDYVLKALDSTTETDSSINDEENESGSDTNISTDDDALACPSPGKFTADGKHKEDHRRGTNLGTIAKPIIEGTKDERNRSDSEDDATACPGSSKSAADEKEKAEHHWGTNLGTFAKPIVEATQDERNPSYSEDVAPIYPCSSKSAAQGNEKEERHRSTYPGTSAQQNDSDTTMDEELFRRKSGNYNTSGEVVFGTTDILEDLSYSAGWNVNLDSHVEDSFFTDPEPHNYYWQSGDAQSLKKNRIRGKKKIYAKRNGDRTKVALADKAGNREVMEGYKQYLTRTSAAAAATGSQVSTVPRYVGHMFTYKDSWLEYSTRQDPNFKAINLVSFAEENFQLLIYPLHWVNHTGTAKD